MCVSSVLLAFWSPCLEKRELAFVLIVHLFFTYAHVNLCHFFSSSWYRGLAAASVCDSFWNFLFTFPRNVYTDVSYTGCVFYLICTLIVCLTLLVVKDHTKNHCLNRMWPSLIVWKRWRVMGNTLMFTIATMRNLLSSLQIYVQKKHKPFHVIDKCIY